MPSRGKRRCARNADDGSTSLDVKEEKMDKKDALGGDNEDGVELQDHMAVSGSNSEEEIKIGAMRARKLVKYCSLESFSKHHKRDDFMPHLCCFNKPFLLGQVNHHMQLISTSFPPWTRQPSYATHTDRLSYLDKSTIICNSYQPPFLPGQVNHHMQLLMSPSSTNIESEWLDMAHYPLQHHYSDHGFERPHNQGQLGTWVCWYTRMIGLFNRYSGDHMARRVIVGGYVGPVLSMII